MLSFFYDFSRRTFFGTLIDYMIPALRISQKDVVGWVMEQSISHRRFSLPFFTVLFVRELIFCRSYRTRFLFSFL